MKTWVLRIRSAQKWVFRAVKSGKKNIETRALGHTKTGKNFGNIKKGDVLFFLCGENRLKKKVKRVQRFKSVKAMLAKTGPKRVWPHLKNPNLKEIEEIYYQYPGYRERIKKYGLVAIWI